MYIDEGVEIAGKEYRNEEALSNPIIIESAFVVRFNEHPSLVLANISTRCRKYGNAHSYRWEYYVHTLYLYWRFALIPYDGEPIAIHKICENTHTHTHTHTHTKSFQHFSSFSLNILCRSQETWLPVCNGNSCKQSVRDLFQHNRKCDQQWTIVAGCWNIALAFFSMLSRQ